MNRIFQSFVDALADGVDATSLHDALADVSVAFGFPWFAYFCIPAGFRAPTWLISNYSSEWTDRYLGRRYDHLDPVIVRAEAGIEPFLWGEQLLADKGSEAEARFFEEASGFGIRHGFTVPIREPRTRVSAVTFAVDQSASAFEQSIAAHGKVLQLMAIYFHRHARQILAADRVVNGVRLTRRELECLQWAAHGKSAGDIGTILGISRKTAAFHLDNLRAKLDVRSTSQAVALLAARRSGA
jgi:DNA-binding CsgD family transcriptional regulator